ncbi:hypothetical protein [Chryseobacterium sp. Leaf201]|nr:hypothetical protein [Chryseobacterium sp. Leaf201]
MKNTNTKTPNKKSKLILKKRVVSANNSTGENTLDPTIIIMTTSLIW